MGRPLPNSGGRLLCSTSSTSFWWLRLRGRRVVGLADATQCRRSILVLVLNRVDRPNRSLQVLGGRCRIRLWSTLSSRRSSMGRVTFALPVFALLIIVPLL